jgi:hypothetical protein
MDAYKKKYLKKLNVVDDYVIYNYINFNINHEHMICNQI